MLCARIAMMLNVLSLLLCWVGLYFGWTKAIIFVFAILSAATVALVLICGWLFRKTLNPLYKGQFMWRVADS